MKDGLLEYNEINLNSSGFDDDSIVSDNDESNEKKNDNFILKTNSHKSIEEDLKVSYDKNKTSLKGDLEIMNPDKKDLNKDNNNEDVMYEDLFSKLYEISLSQPSKFSNRKIGHQFTYESNSKIINYKIDSLKFGLSKNTEVITYLLSLFIFSEFLNLEEIEKDKRLKVIFVKQNKDKKQFIINDKNALLNNLEIPLDKENDFEMFINGINDFLSEKKCLDVQKNNKKRLYKVYGIIALTIILCIIIIICIFLTIKDIDTKKDDKNKYIISLVIEIISLVFFGFILGLKSIDAKNLQLTFLFYNLKFLLKNYNRINEHIEEWNRNLFENYNIIASVPISLNYIMFNLNPYQNIDIKHLDMNWLKKRYYKNQNDIFKNEKERKLFNMIKTNMIKIIERNSSIIN
jgi:hypothetical protein